MPLLDSSPSPPDKYGLSRPRVAAGSSAWPSGSPAGTEMLFWGLPLFSGSPIIVPERNSDRKSTQRKYHGLGWNIPAYVLQTISCNNSIIQYECMIVMNSAVLLYISTLSGVSTDSTDAVTCHKHSSLTSCNRVYNKYYKGPVTGKRHVTK